jgi:hypothetical protein
LRVNAGLRYTQIHKITSLLKRTKVCDMSHHTCDDSQT